MWFYKSSVSHLCSVHEKQDSETNLHLKPQLTDHTVCIHNPLMHNSYLKSWLFLFVPSSVSSIIVGLWDQGEAQAERNISWYETHHHTSWCAAQSKHAHAPTVQVKTQCEWHVANETIKGGCHQMYIFGFVCSPCLIKNQGSSKFHFIFYPAMRDFIGYSVKLRYVSSFLFS